MRWITFACVLVASAQAAHAAPIFDEERGQARDSFRDFDGVDTGPGSLTAGVANNPTTNLVRLDPPNLIGTVYTLPYVPQSAGAWQKVYLGYTAAAPDDLALAVYSADGTLIADVPLVPTTQAGFRAEADLSGIDFTTHPSLRFAITLDGTGALFAPVLDEVLVTWQPIPQIDLLAIAPSTETCAGDTFTIDVPVSVSFVRAEGLVVKIDKPVPSNYTHPTGDLQVVGISHAQSATSPALVATTPITFDALQVAAGDVYWAFNGPVAAGSSFVFSVTYRVPAGIDNHTNFTTRAHADATNAPLISSSPLTLATTATPDARVTARYTTAYSSNGIFYADQEETIVAHVRVDNVQQNPCGQTLHDLVVVDDLSTFNGLFGRAYAGDPTSISHNGVYIEGSQSFNGHIVYGPAVVWTIDQLAPGARVDYSYSLTLASEASLPDGSTPERTASVVSTFDNIAAYDTREVVVGLPDGPDGNFAIGQRYRGLSEVRAYYDDLAGLNIPGGSPYTFVLFGSNRGLSALEGVNLFFPIPDGLDFVVALASSHAEIFYHATFTDIEPPDVAAGELGPSWTNDPALLTGPVRWVVARADLASRHFPTGPTSVTLEVDVAETEIALGACSSARYDGLGIFSVTSYLPHGASESLPTDGSYLLDIEPLSSAPSQPRIHEFGVSRDLGQRLGAGPIEYTIHVANDGSVIDTIDVGRDAVLEINLPRVELSDGPGTLPVLSFDAGDGIADTSALASGKLYIRWPLLAARSSRDVKVTVYWPGGSIDGAIAEVRATLTVDDDFCAPSFAVASAATTLLVRPALTIDKIVDLDAAAANTELTYTLTARNDGEGASMKTTVFDPLPPGVDLVRVLDPGFGGTVWVSNAQPPVLPASFTDLAQFDRALVDAHFVPAVFANGAWTSPLANTTWIAIDFDDHSLTPPRLRPGQPATATIVASIGNVPSQAVINNRAAIDADTVTAAVSGPCRTSISSAPTARVTRDMPALITSGETFTYTVAVANTGISLASSLVLSEVLPPGVTYLGATFAWNANSTGRPAVVGSLSGDTLTWDLGTDIASLQGGVATITVRADDTLATGDLLDFEATALLANLAFTASSTVRVSVADLVAEISLDRLDPIAGDRVTAYLSLDNIGEHVADGTGFTVRVPAALEYVASSTSVVGYVLGEPTTLPVLDGGGQTIAYDLVWTNLTKHGQPVVGRIPGESGPIAIRIQLDVAPGTPPLTSLPITLTATTSTGQGGATDNDSATVVAQTPEADPNVELIAPAAVKPGQIAATTVRYGNDSRQPAGASTIVVTVPTDGVPNTFVSANATNGETLYYFVGSPGATLTLPGDPLANSWTTTPSADTTHVAIVTAGMPGNARRDVVLQTRFTTISGDLVSGGTHHETCAVITSTVDDDIDNNNDCQTIDVASLNLTAELTGSPDGAFPGVAVGGTVTYTATVANTGLAPSFGTYLEFDQGALLDTSSLPSFATIDAVGPGGLRITQPIPLTLDGDRILIGTNGGESDPLDYKNVGLLPNESFTLTFTGTVPEGTTSGTVFDATFTVGSDYAYDHNPNADPELATDNVATASVTAYRPDLMVAMSATNVGGTNAPVGTGERIIWTVTYDNIGDIAAADATLTSTIAGGSAFVVGSIVDVPVGFQVQYLGPAGWDYIPSGAAGTIDLSVRAVRMVGAEMGTLLNPSYIASTSALAAGTNANTQYANGRVSSLGVEGDVWTSEVVTSGDIAEWTRVTFADRQGDDALRVTVLDGNGQVVPGYADVVVDSSDTIDIGGIDPETYGSLQFQVSFEGESPVCDLASGRTVSIAPEGDSFRNRALVTAGAWAGGAIELGQYQGQLSVPALWGPTGGGTDGWEAIELPKLPGHYSVEYRVIGINHDATAAIGASAYFQVSWTKGQGGWSVHLIPGTLGAYETQGRYYRNLHLPANVVPTATGYLYYDPTSLTGVRHLAVGTMPGLVPGPYPGSGAFSMQSGTPIYVHTGSQDGGPLGPVVWYFDGDDLIGERLPGDGQVHSVHPTRPLLVGQSTGLDGKSYATLWSRESGVWVRDAVEAENTSASVIMGDGTLGGTCPAGVGASYCFYQKQNGAWMTFPLQAANIDWDDVVAAGQDNFVFGSHTVSGRTYATVWRTPRLGEQAVTAIHLGESSGDYPRAILREYAYIDNGIFIGTVEDSPTTRHLASWRVAADDSFVEINEDPSETLSWNGPSDFSRSLGQKGHNVWRPSDGYGVWVPNATGATIAPVTPANYWLGSDYIVPNPDADIQIYGSHAKGLLYGCWMGSDASFAGFAVGYRSLTPPSYTFRTEVLADTCQVELAATTTAATTTPDAYAGNDTAEADIAFAHAELTTTLRASRSIAVIGTTVTYEGTITNAGPAIATNVVASLLDPDGVAQTSVIGPLDVGASVDVDFDYVVGAALDGSIVNATLTTTADSADCNPDDDSANAALIVTNLPNVWVSLSGPDTVLVGSGAFDLTVTYGNDGALATDAGTIDLVLPEGLSFVNPGDAILIVPPMVPGEQFSTPVQVIADSRVAGRTVNTTATIAVSGDVLGADDVDLLATRFSQTYGTLGVSVHGNQGAVGAGDQVGFVVAFDYHGELAATGASLVVALPAGTYVAGSSTGVYNAGARTLTWPLGDLAPASTAPLASRWRAPATSPSTRP